jgi:hypothetical protein
MWKPAIVFYLLGTSAVLAGQGSGQFQVGITITGKGGSPASSASSNTTGAATASASAGPLFRAKIGPRRRVGYCSWMYPSFNPATGTYVGNDGRPHSCE